ncbi:MAG: alpha/beta hydrolase [Rickettsiales bacterium]|jgi:pimeloyl-ACP methyl ester carboxylesterase|nr:alpha/beta hydrolase [Rickettsiales bacterium]
MQIIYLPGWLNPAAALAPIADIVGGDAQMLDFPTDAVRSVADFADWVAAQIDAPAFIVGHSFGGKVAVALAARHPDIVRGIFVVSGSNRGRWIFRALRPLIKLAKAMGFSGARFRASDYSQSSEIMKKNMARTLDFNIMPLAHKIKCPATFIYGANDRTTRPTLGRKLARATGGRFFELPGYNHNSIITDGAWQVGAIVRGGLGE